MNGAPGVREVRGPREGCVSRSRKEGDKASVRRPRGAKVKECVHLTPGGFAHHEEAPD
jgi:hypothetical protein